MWVKALYCTQDQEYAERLTAFFDVEYGNKIELNICSSMERAVQLLDGIDVFCVGKEYEHEIAAKIRQISCPVAIMADQVYDNGRNTMMQIEKYQRADAIYRQILEVYASGSEIKKTRTDAELSGAQRVYVFTSANGGNGTTTIARAFAQKCSVYEKTLYIDFGMYNTLSMEEQQSHGMDELIMALKSRRNVLPVKLSSTVSKTIYGFYSYGNCSNPINLLEINAEDMKVLMKELTNLKEYSCIVIDIGMLLTERELVTLGYADEIVYIMDEREISQQKFGIFLQLMEALEKRDQIKMLNKIAVFRNKVNKDYDMENWSYPFEIRGWAPEVMCEAESELIARIAASDSFHNLEVQNAGE